MNEDSALFLAAEECPVGEFAARHSFDQHDERIIRALMAHGPVLIRGGRGAGKSALLLEANRRLEQDATRIPIYVSLRYLPLLETTGLAYLNELISLVARTAKQASISTGVDFDADVVTLEQLKERLVELSRTCSRRLVLFFDDPAHIGREASLDEFFDSFRILSSAEISCKASIYPGVTRFGSRFDIFNDANVLDVSKDERTTGYDDFFLSVVRCRRIDLLPIFDQFQGISPSEIAGLLGRTVLGNMRGFAVALGKIEQFRYENNLNDFTRILVDLAGSHYWGLLEEVTPKLGRYEPTVKASHEFAQILFELCADSRSSNVVIHRDICQQYAKALEILEYVGFVARREASRKVGTGRGPRFRLNWAVLLEHLRQRKLSKELVNDWSDGYSTPTEIFGRSRLNDVVLPAIPTDGALSVLDLPIDKLLKGSVYPYGLTEDKLIKLKEVGLMTIGSVAKATDSELDSLRGVAEYWVKRIRDVVAQAIWM